MFAYIRTKDVNWIDIGIKRENKIHRKKVCGDVFVRKQAFLDNKNMDLTKLEIGIFPKEIVHEFGKKVEVFSSFIFIKNRSRKCLLMF